MQLKDGEEGREVGGSGDRKTSASRPKRKSTGTNRSVCPGEILRLELTGIAPGGLGTVQEGGRRFYVWGGLPGDLVDARVVKLHRGRVEARVERLPGSRIRRIAPRCRHFAVCGGCLWQDLAYADQLDLKKGIVAHCLRRAGVRGAEVVDVMGSRDVFFYRNRMDFSFGQHADRGLALGLFADVRKAGGDTGEERLSSAQGRMPPVFDLETCHLQSEMSNRLVGAVRAGLAEAGLRAYNPESRSGVLRFLAIREGKRTGEALVHLTVGSARLVPGRRLAESLMGAFDAVKGVVLSVSRKRSRHAVPKTQEVLAGSGRIAERILGLEVEVSPTSFLQVNTRQAERLYELAIAAAGLTGTERVLDLYCGTGVLSLLLAQRSACVTGVEALDQAVEDARRNAGRNGSANCRFVCGDALRVLPELVARGEPVDVATVNPPRTGMQRRVLDAVCRLRPQRVVYISCNPETLARDLVAFRPGGYVPERVQPVDLFPHTPHCEVVVTLSPKGAR